MISCRTIIGTAVIEIEKGIGLGEIHQVLVDEGVLLTFVVKSRDSDQSYALLSGKNIYGIGDFAAMVETSSVLQDIDETGLKALNDKQGVIFDEMAITIDGNKIGRVMDYHIDKQNEVGFLLVDPGNEEQEIQIPKSKILMMGKEYIILRQEKDSNVVNHLHSDQPVVKESEQTVDLINKRKESVQQLDMSRTAEVKKGETKFESLADMKELQEKFDLDSILAQLYPKADKNKEKNVADGKDDKLIPDKKTIVPVLPNDKVLTDRTDKIRPEQSVGESVEPVLNLREDDKAILGDGSSVEGSEVKPKKVAVEVTENKREAVTNNRVVSIPFLKDSKKSFLSEQKRLLLGKKLHKNLVGTDGNTILFAGDVVTDETIDVLRCIDRKLLVRLAECVV